MGVTLNSVTGVTTTKYVHQIVTNVNNGLESR